MTYASGTKVSAESSRSEIERTLSRYGADAFGYFVDGPVASVGFRMKGRYFKFRLTMPSRDERRFTHHSRGARTADSAFNEWDQACRQKWRALLLVVKAKLEAVSAGISSFEEEFLANVVLPDGRIMGEWAKPAIENAYLTSEMPSPALMLGGPK